MCIIVYHPNGADMVAKRNLKKCWDTNDDGAGYSFWDKASKMWIVKKGFMEWDIFWASFNSHNFSKRSVWIAHFRIATAGNTDGGNTHPFQICTNYSKMRQHSFRAKKIAYHNGVVGKGEDIASDTMTHIKHYIAPLFPSIHKKKIKKIIVKLCEASSSRWIMTNGSKLFFFGDWEEENGVYYSNKTYKIYPVYKYANKTTYNHGSAYGYSTYETYKKRKEAREKLDAAKEKVEKKDQIECPICGEKHFVMDSKYCVGECTCYTCGAVFDNDTNEIFFFEPEIV